MQEFDERLFGMLVECIKMINLVQVKFMLWTAVDVGNILRVVRYVFYVLLGVRCGA